jgi:hypothetical protein
MKVQRIFSMIGYISLRCFELFSQLFHLLSLAAGIAKEVSGFLVAPGLVAGRLGKVEWLSVR